MEIREVGKWPKDENTEIYFDASYNHYLVRSGVQLEMFLVSSYTSTQIRLEKALQDQFSQRFSQLRICDNRKLLSFLTDGAQLVLNI